MEALNTSLSDPGREIPCPECEEGFLEILDCPVGDQTKAERRLHCPSCKAHNSAIWVPYNPPIPPGS